MMPEGIKRKAEDFAKKAKLNDKDKKKYLDKVEETYNESKISPGESIGVVTAESFGEPATQMILWSFHFAGAAEMNITMGLPRLIEIFDARKNPSTPKMELYLKPKYTKTIQTLKDTLLKIKEIKLGDVCENISVNLGRKYIEVELSRKETKNYSLTPSKVIKKIENSVKSLSVSSEGVKMILKPKDKEIELADVYRLKEKVKNLHVAGLKGIKQVLPVKEDEEYVIHCAGSNLNDALAMEEVDNTKSVTNDIFEIASVLGIEAARNLIIKEAKEVFKGQGLDIDVRHIMFLADIMTRTGKIRGVTRSGITGEKESVLARASFETPIKHIVNASLKGEVDELTSVVENVILNQPIPLGTGLPGLLAKMKEKEGEDGSKK